MRVTVIYPFEYEAKSTRLEAIYRLRRKVFAERLEWDVAVEDDMERDIFDQLRPIQLAVHDDDDRIVGCVRFISCDEPTMLETVFSALLDGEIIPKEKEIYESSRFCIDTEAAMTSAKTGLRVMTHVLFAGMIEWGLSAGVSRIVTVTDTRLERIAARAGWPVSRIAPPQRVGTTDAVAGYLEVSEAAAERVRQRVGLTAAVFDDEEDSHWRTGSDELHETQDSWDGATRWLQ